MAGDDTLRRILNKRLLAEARQIDGNIEELLASDEFRDPEDGESFLFDINCTDLLGNTPLHLAYVAHQTLSASPLYSTLTFLLDNFRIIYSVLSESDENVNLLIEADGCDVDLQNSAGDTPLHLAVQIRDQGVRHAIVRTLVNTAGAVDSIRLTNKAGQTPKALAEIYFPCDDVVIILTTPTQPISSFLDADDIASDVEGGSGPE